jgi:thiamine-monophosphate kinase
MDEFGIIARYFAPLAAKGAFGLKDDAAVIAARPGFDLVVTTDQLAEGVDFFKHDPAAAIARKALRVNLSDLAAKGAVPEYYLLNLAMPAGVTEAWLTDFSAGLAQDQKHFGFSLLGGDLSATEGPLAICVTAFGFVPEGKMVKRAGARPGDAVYVTGVIGDSGGGLALCRGESHVLEDRERDHLMARYRIPEPPMRFGAASLRDFASCAVDVSDGLIADLGHLADASNVGIEVEAEKIPRSAALRALWGEGEAAIARAAAAGDDYQIAFAANPSREQDIMVAGTKTGTPVTRIGKVKAGKGVTLLHQGKELAVAKPGYRHF